MTGLSGPCGPAMTGVRLVCRGCDKSWIDPDCACTCKDGDPDYEGWEVVQPSRTPFVDLLMDACGVPEGQQAYARGEISHQDEMRWPP